MPDILLHHYEGSPYSEKVRRILGFKHLAWGAVDQPIVAPKPKLTPLTGGYRRIPVLQIGADVWCDTAIIARKLEEIAPAPTLYPDGRRGAVEILAHWADHWLFLAAVPPAIDALLPSLPEEFIRDRAAMSPGFTAEAFRAALPGARSRVLVALEWLESELSHHPFLLGEAPCLADFATYHPLWFLRADPASREAMDERPGLRAWLARVDELGTGARTEISADDALAIARDARPKTERRSDGRDPLGIRPGEAIVVAADDYGSDPIQGEAVVVTADEIALRREDPAVGEIVVHFPREGYRLSRV